MNREEIRSLLKKTVFLKNKVSDRKNVSSDTAYSTIYDFVVSLTENDGKFFILLDATELDVSAQNSLKNTLNKLLENQTSVFISFTAEAKPEPKITNKPSKNTMSKKSIPHVRKILVVASGKGGVGKSTTALNLSLSFQKLGLNVGLLDADIYGPSLPLMVGCHDKPGVSIDKKLIPIEKHGLSMMSMGFLIDELMPIIWRGPMVQGALQQLLFEVEWGYNRDLDLLIIDTPPGTGDVQLTLAQELIIDGAIIVSTPQDMALIDAKKAIAMFHKVSIPIIGLIENMAYFCCPSCNTTTHIFSHGGARIAANDANIFFLGDIPLTSSIRQACDDGVPLSTVDANREGALHYDQISNLILGKI